MSTSHVTTKRNHAFSHEKTISRKAQVSLEFMIIFAFVLLIFTAFYAVLSYKQYQASRFQTNTLAQTVADRVTYEMDLVISQGTNFSSTFILPATINGQHYSVMVQATGNLTWVSLQVADNVYLSSSAAPGFVGNISAGPNTFANMGGIIHAN